MVPAERWQLCRCGFHPRCGQCSTCRAGTDPARAFRKPALVLNEINSSPDDWVELMNTGAETLDISGFELRDNSDDHRWRFPDRSTIAAGALLVVDAKSSGLIYDDQAKPLQKARLKRPSALAPAIPSACTTKAAICWMSIAGQRMPPMTATRRRLPTGAIPMARVHSA